MAIENFHLWITTTAALVAVLGGLISLIHWLMQRRLPPERPIRQRIRTIKAGIDGLEINEIKSFFEQCTVPPGLTSSEVDFLLFGLEDKAARAVLTAIGGSIMPASADVSIVVGWLNLFQGQEKRVFLSRILPALKVGLGGNGVLSVLSAESGGAFAILKIVSNSGKFGNLSEADKARILSKVPACDKARAIGLFTEH